MIRALPEMLVIISGTVNPRIFVSEELKALFFAPRAASWRPPVFLELFNLREAGNLFRPQRGAWILRFPHSPKFAIWKVPAGFRRECCGISF